MSVLKWELEGMPGMITALAENERMFDKWPDL